ncbi:septum site-determining protein MinC [Acinetobacter sp. c1-l78]|uniref:septum site-determining protein MinC n=1 Tax=Acinetobacter sp. c1-l78 TaxID=3342803 RepID=UPI0035BA1F1E
MADIRIIGRMVKFSRLSFDSNNLDELRQQLSQIFAQNDYHGTPVVINSSVPQDLIALIQLLMEFGLQPMAVIDGVLSEDARAIQFPILPADQSVQRITPTSEQDIVAQSAGESHVESIATIQSQHKTIYHDDMLRTGQSLIEEADIVLTSSMNSGSEIISSGNVYIYGAGRGRIIAGASGEQNARIFCHSLEAQLVSIAGTYCLADDIPAEFLKKPVQISLNSQQELEFHPLTI